MAVRQSAAATADAEPRVISREVARRYLAIHHFLTPPRSLPSGTEGVLAVFDRLGSIQFDPIEIAGRNHDLVLLARVADYGRELRPATGAPETDKCAASSGGSPQAARDRCR